MALNERQQLFIEEYFANGCNATAAYRKIYKHDSYNTHALAGQLMNNPRMKQAIQERFEVILGDKEIISNRILQELEEVAFCDKTDTDYLPMKMKAIDLLQKQLSLQSQNLNASIEANSTIEINIIGDNPNENQPEY